MNDIPIPNYVDAQPQVFFWEVDEFLPALAIFIALFLWDQPALAIILSYAFVKLFSSFKSNNMDGVLFHMSWWSGFLSLNKKFPNGLEREKDE